MQALGRLSFLTATVTGALLALPAFAAETTEEVSSGSDGLPQFDVLYFPGQLFWLVISFALLYVLMTYVALPKVKSTQDKRHDMLAAELQAAQTANEKAKAIILNYEKALADARSNAQKTVADIMAQGARKLSESQAAQQQKMQQRLRETEAKIAAERDAALGKVQLAATEVASALLEKLSSTAMKVNA